MLPKNRRISKHFFLNKKDKCKQLSFQFFSARVCKNNLKLNRASVVISKKVVPNAVDRNYIRRMLYDILRDRLKGIDKSVGENHDFILYLKKINNEIEYSDFQKEIDKLFKLFI